MGCMYPGVDNWSNSSRLSTCTEQPLSLGGASESRERPIEQSNRFVIVHWPSDFADLANALMACSGQVMVLEPS